MASLGNPARFHYKKKKTIYKIFLTYSAKSRMEILHFASSKTSAYKKKALYFLLLFAIFRGIFFTVAPSHAWILFIEIIVTEPELYNWRYQKFHNDHNYLPRSPLFFSSKIFQIMTTMRSYVIITDFYGRPYM